MTPEDVARAWASWCTADIVEQLDEEGLLVEGREDEVHDIILSHLTDVASSNMTRPAAAVAPRLVDQEKTS